MRWVRVLLLLSAVGLTTPVPSAAQYLYLDANADSINTADDRLSGIGSTHIDVWFVSDRNRDGSAAVCASGGSLTLFSYMFVLQAVDGEVVWGDYVNNQSGMGTAFGGHSSPTEFMAGFGGTSILPPGRHKLGTLSASVLSGSPAIAFAAASPGYPDNFTGFGSECPGGDQDYTLKLGSDWNDADGLGPPLEGRAVFRGNVILSGQGEPEPPPTSPAGVDSGCPQSIVACDMSPRPSITSAGAYTGTYVSRDTITYYVTDLYGVKRGCQVRVYATSNLASEINTGGHCHNPSTRPLPLLEPTSGNTGDDGYQFKVLHTWPEVGGRYHIFFEDAPGDTCGEFLQIFTVCVRREPSFSAGLAALPGPGPGYELTHGPDNITRHPDHHYGTPRFNKVLMDVATAFRDSIPGVPILGYNDMSLRWGGVFDVDSTQVWLPPHKGHRNGDMCDMRTHVAGLARYTGSQLRVLKKILENNGLRPLIHLPGSGVAPHWHLQPISKGSFN